MAAATGLFSAALCLFFVYSLNRRRLFGHQRVNGIIQPEGIETVNAGAAGPARLFSAFITAPGQFVWNLQLQTDFHDVGKK